jgi:hypothetical protein
MQLGVSPEQFDPIPRIDSEGNVVVSEQRHVSSPKNFERGSFLNGEYSNFLVPLSEASLWEASRDLKICAYQFSWWRTFDARIVVRLTLPDNGSSILQVKIWGRMSDYYRTLKLTNFQVNQFLSKLEETNFWSMPSTHQRHGFDGARWIIEGVRDGQYHVVNRWCPEEEGFRDAVLMLVELAGLNVQRVY